MFVVFEFVVLSGYDHPSRQLLRAAALRDLRDGEPIRCEVNLQFLERLHIRP